MSTVQTQTRNLPIELLRGIAAIMVMLCHYANFIYDAERSWMNFLYTGVDLFFVISGFVFAPTILAPMRENLTAFSIRRAFRIYPLFLFAIILYALLPAKLWDSSIFFQHAFFLHTTISKEIAFYYNPAFWSLPVEVEFYLLIALFMFLKIKNVKFVLVILFSLSILTSLLVHNTLPDGSNIKLITLHHLPNILPEFLLGIFAYIVSRNCNKFFGILSGITGILLLLALGKGFVVHGDNINNMIYGLFNLLCALGYQCIIIAGVTLFRQIRDAVTLGLIANLLGNLSYGIYLFHNATPPLLNLFIELEGFVLFISSILTTIFISGIMYIALENPARRFGRRLSSQYYKPS